MNARVLTTQRHLVLKLNGRPLSRLWNVERSMYFKHSPFFRRIVTSSRCTVLPAKTARARRLKRHLLRCLRLSITCVFRWVVSFPQNVLFNAYFGDGWPKQHPLKQTFFFDMWTPGILDNSLSISLAHVLMFSLSARNPPSLSPLSLWVVWVGENWQKMSISPDVNYPKLLSFQGLLFWECLSTGISWRTSIWRYVVLDCKFSTDPKT